MKSLDKPDSLESRRELLDRLDKKIAEYERKYPQKLLEGQLTEDQLEAMFRNEYRRRAAALSTQSDSENDKEVMGGAIDWFARQGETSADNLDSIMPIVIYRVTWQEDGVNREFLTRSYDDAYQKKYEIDHSSGKMLYFNFESWFAYRSFEHDDRFGEIKRERGWWEQNR